MSNIDKDTFDRFIKDVGNENAEMILDLFIKEMREYENSLKKVASLTSIKEIMHKLKSSALSMGASTVANLAIEIENLARNENSKSFDLLPDLYEAFQNTINFFNDYKKLLK
jgi:HPt (histidine-containing phosphotransfer) domain-containing protein